jgi:hypothetical protein
MPRRPICSTCFYCTTSRKKVASFAPLSIGAKPADSLTTRLVDHALPATSQTDGDSSPQSRVALRTPPGVE